MTPDATTAGISSMRVMAGVASHEHWTPDNSPAIAVEENIVEILMVIIPNPAPATNCLGAP
jgi:hypothetical protein